MRVSTCISATRSGVLFVFLALTSCSASILAQSSTRSDVNAELRLQVCVPTKRIYFNDMQLDPLENHPQFTRYSQEELALAPKTIRRVAPSNDPRVANDPSVDRDYVISFGEVRRIGERRDVQYSAGSGWMPLRDSTIADQPVYEKRFMHSAREYVAVSVRLPGPDMPTYWFRLPKNIAFESFSGWLPPASMESDRAARSDESIWYRLTRGADLPIYPVSGEPPKIRVALRKGREKNDDPTTDSLPALTTARMRNRAANVYEFVPKAVEAISKCD